MRIRILVTVPLCLAVSLVACTQVSVTRVKGEKQYGVVLDPKPNPPPGTLFVNTGPQGWNKSLKKNGYVGFGTGESGFIVFGFKGKDVDNSCSSGNGNGPDVWVITKIELSATGDPATEKGSNFGNSQMAYPWLKDAFPAVDLNDGSIFKAADKMEGRITYTMQDTNAQVGEKFIYYQVTATNCADGSTVQIDPGVGNTGK